MRPNGCDGFDGAKNSCCFILVHLRRCFPRPGFLSTPYALNSDYSLYNQPPTTLATMISAKPTMLPMTNRRFGNNPNGICPRVGSAYPTTQYAKPVSAAVLGPAP